MGWEQAVVGLLMVVGFIFNFVKWCQDVNRSSGEVALLTLLSIAYCIGYSLVLHSGGFW